MPKVIADPVRTLQPRTKLSLEDLDYVERTKAKWRSLPLDMIVMEYHGTGDPFFGGSADDRPLRKDGRIMDRTSYDRSEIAEFASIEEAHEAAKRVTNRRPGSILGVSPRWR